ncbi:amidohydrolase family protein [Parapusillimonas sp. SGNA-6]|nr:amidohydrolase family protein [Parapusillimonas sp. SGNA-6]
MITDIHCHYVPAEFLRFAQGHDKFSIKVEREDADSIDFSIRGRRFTMGMAFFDKKLQLQRMAEVGVGHTVLSLATPFIDYHLESKLAVEACRVFNDGLAAMIDEDRTRFSGWAFLPMQDPQAAALELRRCVHNYGFIGGHIASNVRGTYLYDDRFKPIWEAAIDLDVPMFVHPADPPGKERTKDFELTVVAGYLFDNTINILGLVCSGFLDRWPRLKLIFAHAGAFSLILRERMQREVDTNPNLSAMMRAPVGDYLQRLYYDTVCFEPTILNYVANSIPPSHLLLGSDAPFPLGEPDPVNFVRRSLSPRQSRAVLHDNFGILTVS